MITDINVDVIIPNYNETTLLSRAIDSVLIQKVSVNRIIIVDDGSDEQTLKYLNANFSGTDKIQIVYSPRQNHPGVMREIGIKHSNSEWIAFLDADDFWEPDKLSKQLSFALKNNYHMVCSNAHRFQNFVRVGVFYQLANKPEVNTRSLLRENVIINSSVLIRRDCFRKIDGYPTDYYLRGVEDYSAWLRLSVHYRIGFLNEALVNYEDQLNSFGKQQNPILRNIAIFDFIFWSKQHASFYIRLSSKYYIFRVLGRS